MAKPASVIYIGAFLSDEEKARLLLRFPPQHPEVHAHHVTLAFKPAPDNPLFSMLGDELEFPVIGHCSDPLGQALEVACNSSANSTPHITLSCGTGTKPVYSNTMLAALGSVPIDEPYVVRTRILAHMSDGRRVAVLP